LRFKGEECTACRDACSFGSINYEDNDRIHDLKVGAIVLATGFDEFDLKKAPQYRHGEIENIYTGIEFEKVLNSSGPTSGKVLLKNGKPPERIALIHCVGSRSKKYNEYCSGVCCMYLLKFAHMIKEQLPDVPITGFYSDFCLPGKEYQSFFNKIADKKEINFVRSGNLDSMVLNKTKDGILIEYEDIDGASKTAFFDMVVLSVSMEGSKDSEKIAALFDISCDRSGFFIEEHARLAPVSTTTEGIFIAGCAQGPKDIPSSVADGQAAAGNILSRLMPGEKLKIEPIFAEVDKEACSGCKVCIGLCPYHAITYDEKDRHADINELLCRGCGICAAACPGGAIKARHFTDKQILSELKGLLK
jgi:heterodisulfide reductase subunit A